MKKRGIAVGAWAVLMLCSSSFGEEVTFLPTAFIADDWIAHVYAKVTKEGIEIRVHYQFEAGGRVLMYEDVSVSIVDGERTRAVRIPEKGVITFAAMAGMAQASFTVHVDAKEIRAVNVRVGDLVVSLVPSVKTGADTSKSVPQEKTQDKPVK